MPQIPDIEYRKRAPFAHRKADHTVEFGSVFLIALIFCTIAVVFFTSAIGHMLEGSMAIEWVYSIIGAIYLSIVAVLFLLRRKLLLDPICRFLSKLIAEPPAEIPANNTSNPS